MFESYQLLDTIQQEDLNTSISNTKGDIVYVRDKLTQFEDLTNENIKTLSNDIHHLNTIIKELQQKLDENNNKEI